MGRRVPGRSVPHKIKNTLFVWKYAFLFLTFLLSIVLNLILKFLKLGRGVPGRRVPVKKSIWAEESRAEMVLGRGVPEPGSGSNPALVDLIEINVVWRCCGITGNMSELHSYDLKPSKQFYNTFSMIIVSTEVQISCGPHLKVCLFVLIVV